MTRAKKDPPNANDLPLSEAKLKALAAKYENQDMSGIIGSAEVVDEPMTTISLRLPVHVVEDLKKDAKTRHIRGHTRLARQLIEEGLYAKADLETRVTAIEAHLHLPKSH